METITLNVCGLSCPEPVLQTQAALKNLGRGERLEVITDTAGARENIARMAAYKGWQVTVLEQENCFCLQINHK